MPHALREILIIGITESGSPFRPSDWAERLCGVMSLFGEDQRISYSPFVRPIVSAGARCVVVDVRLQELQPEAFAFLLGFARDNELRVQEGAETALPPARSAGAGVAADQEPNRPPAAAG
jgi:hypothetical protein